MFRLCHFGVAIVVAGLEASAASGAGLLPSASAVFCSKLDKPSAAAAAPAAADDDDDWPGMLSG